MSRTLIIGGHGKVALLLSPLLASAGVEVTSVIRNADQSLDIEAAAATPLVADVQSLDQAQLTEMMRGFDAVVWTAGAGGGNPERTYAVDRDAAIRSMDAAQAAGVERYVMVSYFGAGPDHGVREDDAFFPYAEAKSAADAYLEQTGLHWTILRPSRLTLDEPTGRIDADASQGSQVSRANVAAVAAATVTADTPVSRRVIAFNDGDTPIADVVGLG